MKDKTLFSLYKNLTEVSADLLIGSAKYYYHEDGSLFWTFDSGLVGILPDQPFTIKESLMFTKLLIVKDYLKDIVSIYDCVLGKPEWKHHTGGIVSINIPINRQNSWDSWILSTLLKEFSL